MTTFRFSAGILMFSGAVLLFLTGCGNSVREKYEAHERLCRKHARLVIYNANLWAEFIEGSRKEQRAGEKRVGAEPGPLVLISAPGFQNLYGSAKESGRPDPGDTLTRADRHIYKKNVPVAQLVDFSITIPQFAYTDSPTCAGRFPELYFGKREHNTYPKVA